MGAAADARRLPPAHARPAVRRTLPQRNRSRSVMKRQLATFPIAESARLAAGPIAWVIARRLSSVVVLCLSGFVFSGRWAS